MFIHSLTSDSKSIRGDARNVARMLLEMLDYVTSDIFASGPHAGHTLAQLSTLYDFIVNLSLEIVNLIGWPAEEAQ